MRISEWHAEDAHQPVSQIRSCRKSGGRSRLQPVVIGHHIPHHALHSGHGEHPIVGGIKDLLFVFLHVFRIRQRQTFHHRHQGNIGPENPADFGADQFRGIRIFLLRHDRRTGRKPVRKRHEPKLRGRPDHQLFGKTAQMHGRNAGDVEKLQGKVAITDAIQRIGTRPVKAQRIRSHVSVNGKGRSGQSGGAQRALIHPRARIAHPRQIPAKHLHISHYVMAPCDRLRHLQMSKSWHHPIGTGLRLGEARSQESDEPLLCRVQLIADPKPKISGHLIIPATSRMQPTRRFPDNVLQSRLNIHVNVFQGGRKFELSGLDL